MNIDKFLTSKLFKGIMVGLSALVILLVGFGLGMAVGIKKSEFSYRWQQNRPMMGLPGQDGGFFRQLDGRDFMNSHGIIGQISDINGTVLTIKDRDNTEKSVLTDDKTAIETAGKPAKISDLRAGDTVVVIGDPDDKGEIQAKLIRTMPSGPGPFPQDSTVTNQINN
jgi:hypothetical protein